MSGPVNPPLTVSDVADGGSITGRPITTIEVTDGTLSISGRTATLTTGGGGSGTVTSIATTGPLTGGTITTTGTLAIDQSDSTTDGYLSSTDWNTFNSKGSGTVTSIATTGPLSGGTITTTGTLTIDQSDSTTDGYLSSTDWNTFNSKGSGDGTVTSITPAADSGTGSAITTSGTLTFTGGTNVTTSVTGTTVTINASGGGSISFPLEADDTPSESAPSYSFDGDGNTGMYSGGADVIAFSGGGSKQMSIEPNGILTVGTGSHAATLTSNSTQNLQLNTNGGTNSGTIIIEPGVDGDIRISPDGNGLIHFSGAYTFPVTDGDANQVLTTDGAGALTFEDAGGGGSTFSPALPQTNLDASNEQCPLAQIAPYGSTITTTFAMYASSSGDKIFCQPFIAPLTADISDLIIYINSPTSSACNLFLGLYSDSSGTPNAMIGKGTVDISSDGTKTMTSFTDFGGSAVTLSLTVGVQYWFVFTRSVTSLGYTYQGISSYALPAMSFGGYPGMSQSWCGVLRNSSGSQLTLPETITATDLEPFGTRGRIDVMAKFS